MSKLRRILLKGEMLPFVCALIAEGWNLLFLRLWDKTIGPPWAHLFVILAGYGCGRWFASSIRKGHWGLAAGVTAGMIVGGINAVVVYPSDPSVMVIGAVIGIVPGVITALVLAPFVRRSAD